ncbi:tetratricopeptide repeat protein [Sphingomonas sp. ASV193]|uniref:tetratricopeptide repeat protein n=1 Tax=Sphingomonas sp. ASV193 TaxID=3144405 RepID=UPI0032E89D54
MSFVLLALIVAIAAGLMWLLRLRGPMLVFGLAALLVGSAGYVLQGHPGLDGAPREGVAPPPPLPLAGARAALMDQFSYGAHWLVMADALESEGETQDAVNLIAAQIKRHPDDYDLWVGLGNALVDHGHGLTPAAQQAFDRAQAIGPAAPAAPFFRGLAMARSGQVDEGVAVWRDLLAHAPANASWRPFIENAISMVSGGGPLPAAPPPATNPAPTQP